MQVTRREALLIGGGAFAASTLISSPLFASKTDEAVLALTGGAELGEGAITLTAPEIAENGNTVPISVSADGAKSSYQVNLNSPASGTTASNAKYGLVEIAGSICTSITF